MGAEDPRPSRPAFQSDRAAALTTGPGLEAFPQSQHPGQPTAGQPNVQAAPLRALDALGDHRGAIAEPQLRATGRKLAQKRRLASVTGRKGRQQPEPRPPPGRRHRSPAGAASNTRRPSRRAAGALAPLSRMRNSRPLARKSSRGAPGAIA